MGKRYLIDSNAFIDFLNGTITENGRIFLSEIEPIISVITQIEIFGSRNIGDTEFIKLRSFMEIAEVLPVIKPIALITIDMRLKIKIKLPDAVIAVTAIHHNFALITRNTSDFKNVDGLEVVDPYNL